MTKKHRNKSELRERELEKRGAKGSFDEKGREVWWKENTATSGESEGIYLQLFWEKKGYFFNLNKYETILTR